MGRGTQDTSGVIKMFFFLKRVKGTPLFIIIICVLYITYKYFLILKYLIKIKHTIKKYKIPLLLMFKDNEQ